VAPWLRRSAYAPQPVPHSPNPPTKFHVDARKTDNELALKLRRYSATELLARMIRRAARGVAVAAAGPDAGDIYVTNALDDDVSVIDPTTNTVTIDVGSLPGAVAVSSTGPEVGDIYVANLESDDVSVIDPITNTVVNTIDVGDDPIGLAISPRTGAEAGDIYVTNGVSNTVSVITPSPTG
jgi:YVTN family beta-propeller protein